MAIEDIPYYRRQAEEARERASRLTDEDFKRTWLGIAKSYEALATANERTEEPGIRLRRSDEVDEADISGPMERP